MSKTPARSAALNQSAPPQSLMVLLAPCLQFRPAMMKVTLRLGRYAVCLMLAGVFHFSTLTAPAQSPNRSENPVSAGDAQAIARFEDRVKLYVRERERIESEEMPKLPKETTPEQIHAHKLQFQALVRKARAGAAPGMLFEPVISNYIRATIRSKFKGAELQNLRKTVAEADTRGVPLRVNYPYPEAKELNQIPPTLLLALPQLPKQLRYRFVGRQLLLMDRENGLIVDFMMNAIP